MILSASMCADINTMPLHKSPVTADYHTQYVNNSSNGRILPLEYYLNAEIHKKLKKRNEYGICNSHVTNGAIKSSPILDYERWARS